MSLVLRSRSDFIRVLTMRLTPLCDVNEETGEISTLDSLVMLAVLVFFEEELELELDDDVLFELGRDSTTSDLYDWYCRLSAGRTL